jgi:hypothetical protein
MQKIIDFLKRWSWLLAFTSFALASGIAIITLPNNVPTANKRGNSNVYQLASNNSAPSSGNCAQFDASGNIADAGSACGSGGGGAAGATLFSATASKTVTATSETTLIGTVSGSTTVPANTFTAGQLMEFYASGFYSSPVTAASLTINFKVGGTTQITTGAVVVIPSVTNGVWRFHCGITTRTAGSGGTQIANCLFETTGSTLTPGEAPMQVSSAWTVNTTTTNALDLTATWSTATGSPTITSTNVAAWIPGAPVTSVFGQTGAVNIPVTTTDISTPSNPASGNTKWYTKGGAFCALSPTGTETCTGGGGGSGSFVLVEEHTASSSAELDFTTCFTSTYDDYQVEVVNLVPASNGVFFGIQFSTNGGSTYDSGTNYTWSGLRFTSSASALAGSNAQGSIIITGGSVVNTGTSIGLVGTIHMYDPLNGSLALQVSGQSSTNDGNVYAGFYVGSYNVVAAVNAFRVLTSSGNIASGTVRCYGLTH